MTAPGSYDVTSVADLRAVVGEPLPRMITKETPTLDERANAFIGIAPFLVHRDGLGRRLVGCVAEGRPARVREGRGSAAAPDPGVPRQPAARRRAEPRRAARDRAAVHRPRDHRDAARERHGAPDTRPRARGRLRGRRTAAVVRDRRRRSTGLQPLQQGVSPFRPLGTRRMARPGRGHEPEPLDRRAGGQRGTTRARDSPRGRRELHARA